MFAELETVRRIETEPGSRSQRNVQRSGFALLYGRLILVLGG